MKYDSRNLKYGSTSVIVSAILIASIILVNFVFSALSSKYAFYTDMTKNMTYTITKELKEVLSDVTEDVKIIFCHDRDYVESSTELHDVMLTAEYMADEFDWLEVEYINSINDPQLVSKYKTSIKDPVYTSHVIIESGNEWKKLNAKAFYVVDTDGSTIWGLQAEERFASAILSVTAAEQPIAYYTNTHGEEMSLQLMDIVASAGYKLEPIDLMKDDIAADARLIIINGPTWDFSGGYTFTEGEGGEASVERGVSELEKIDKFLSQDQGAVMVFLDPYAKDLTNLEQYMAEWGIIFDNNIVKDESASVSVDGNAIVAEYCTDDTIASNLIDEIATLITRPKTIFNDAGTISIAPTFSEQRADDNENQTGLGAPTGAFVSGVSMDLRDISPVFKTSQGALSYASSGDTGAAMPADSKNLMTISRQIKVVDNEYYYSYVLAANTVAFDDKEWTDSNVYANEDVIYAALKQFGRENVPSGINFKEYAKYDIEDMTTAEADRDTVILITVLPVLFSVVGFVICIRRKYR